MSTSADPSFIPHQLHRLCARCDGIFQSSAILKDVFQEIEVEEHHFHDNIDSLWQSAASGCHFCSLMKTNLPLPGQPGNTYEHLREEGSPLTLEIEHVEQTTSSDALFNVACRYTRGWSSIHIDDGKRHPRLHPALAQAQTCSPDHALLARNWVETCLTQHTCGHRKNGHFLPTRLFEINGSEEDLNVRLYIPSATDVELGLRYCTLSHCWGDTEVLCLTTATLQDFQQAVSVTTMPATYADAMRIAKSIGVRFLWIDSLCILQDSPDDWAQEASTMASVYENSYCNIAAAIGENSAGGCYATRDPLTFAPCRILATDTRQLYARQYWLDGSLEELEGNCDSGLFSRAWILQELLLPPRVLYFEPKSVYFECQRLRADERNVEGEERPSPAFDLASYDGTQALLTRQVFQWATQNSTTDPRFPYGLHSVWLEIVSRYCELNLSVPGDKLVALAGVAERIIAARKGEQYLSGLWRSTFLSDLPWYVDYLPLLPPMSEFRAPTWSWASVQAPHVRAWNWITLRSAEVSFMASLVDVVIVAHPNDVNKTGKIYGSRLEIKGRLRRMPLTCSTDTHDMFTHNIYYDTDAFRDSQWERAQNARRVEGSFMGRLLRAEYTDEGPEVYYLPIRRIRETDHGHLHWDKTPLCGCGIMGLLVMKVEKGFQRVGLFSMSAREWRHGFRDTSKFDSLIYPYFDECKEETIVFLDGVCRSQTGGSAVATAPTLPS
ncbi:heterokaryon incompatibility protein-domain-containing protein [Podospora aff. communis PSN243]|uniref:Heterokaryon incompatibility protein-domain-containing protein n=1 Tax=Podospora aff. communis PSN243 TaxID=3040156 RepID=A0AAV9GNP4_9PEZI|nr:heterokaryon incompatibility protein-domain-containing protein [Podospora aff. communis PSN243]